MAKTDFLLQNTASNKSPRMVWLYTEVKVTCGWKELEQVATYVTAALISGLIILLVVCELFGGLYSDLIWTCNAIVMLIPEDGNVFHMNIHVEQKHSVHICCIV